MEHIREEVDDRMKAKELRAPSVILVTAAYFFVLGNKMRRSDTNPSHNFKPSQRHQSKSQPSSPVTELEYGIAVRRFSLLKKKARRQKKKLEKRRRMQRCSILERNKLPMKISLDDKGRMENMDEELHENGDGTGFGRFVAGGSKSLSHCHKWFKKSASLLKLVPN
ncbi:hypothetical protein ACFX19_000043 [Malus domestica]